jgi:hypothetical protein
MVEDKSAVSGGTPRNDIDRWRQQKLMAMYGDIND